MVHPTGGGTPRGPLGCVGAPNPEYLFCFPTHPALPSSVSRPGRSLKAISSQGLDKPFAPIQEG